MLIVNMLLMIIGITILAIIISRKLVQAKMKKKMFALSKEEVGMASFQLEGKEVRSKHKLKFIELTAESDLPEAVASREMLIKDAIDIFKQAYYYDLIVAFGYLVAIFITEQIFFVDFEYTFSPILMLFVFFTTVRFLSFRDQFHAYNQNKSILSKVTKLLPFTWKSTADPRWGPLLSLTLMTAGIYHVLEDFRRYDGITLILFMAVVFHAYLLFRYRRKIKETPNFKLLILRVFGMDKTAQFTFEGLLSYWKHFGSFFTVVDPSFLKSEDRQKDLIFNIIVVGIPVGFVFGAITSVYIDLEKIPIYVVLVLMIILAILYIRYSLKLVDDNFVRSKDNLHQRLEKLKATPRKWDHTFKPMPVMCYNNTWRIAVSEFAEISKVILMDLRGLSISQGGCKEEVNYLFDAVPSDKVAFLVDKESLPQVKKMLEEQWELLHETSPNFSKSKATLTIYVSSEENAKDIQGIMDVLFKIAIPTEGIKA